MDTPSFKLDVHVEAMSQDPSLGFLSTVIIITVKRGFEEFIIEKKNDDQPSIKSLGSPPGSSSPASQFILEPRTLEQNDVYQTLHSQLHDRLLSEHIANEIVFQALRERSKSYVLPQQPLFIRGSVKLTQKVYNVVRYNSASPATDLETCAICLEDLSRSDDYLCQMPNCSHCYHEHCVNEWIARRNGSCPLCRTLFDSPRV